MLVEKSLFGVALAAPSSGFSRIGCEPGEPVHIVSALNGLGPVDDLAGDQGDFVFSAGGTSLRESRVASLGDHEDFVLSCNCTFSVVLTDFAAGDHGDFMVTVGSADVEEEFASFLPSDLVTADASSGAPNEVLFPVGFDVVAAFLTVVGDHFGLVLPKGFDTGGDEMEVLVPSVDLVGDQLAFVLSNGFAPGDGVNEVLAPSVALAGAPGRLLCPAGFENTEGEKEDLASLAGLAGRTDELVFAVGFGKPGGEKDDLTLSVGMAGNASDVLFASTFRKLGGGNEHLTPLLAMPPLFSVAFDAGNENLDSRGALAAESCPSVDDDL